MDSTMKSAVPEGKMTLVLNDDYIPLNSVPWKQGMKKILSEADCEQCDGKGYSGVVEHSVVWERIPCSFCLGQGTTPPAQAVEYYDLWIRDSKGREHPVPAVICNTHHVKTTFRKANFSRANVFKRDAYTCQYCGKWFLAKDLTMDHVVPRAMWSGNDTPTNWHNIVAACIDCNMKKGSRTPEQANMPLRKRVNGKVVFYKKPKQANKVELLLGLTHGKIEPEWEQYVEQIMSDKRLDKGA
jgi:5-methylcytosine-specific restriction endonuclease McrA